jgi:hypothetical protein
MIACNIMGGLGNQLFQIFASMAYALENNLKLVFPYEYKILARHTYWETFLNELKFFTTKNENNGVSNYDISLFPRYVEPSPKYTPIPKFGSSNVFLSGYFQSYKYFHSVRSTLFKMIRLDKKKEMVKQKYSHLFFGDGATHGGGATDGGDGTSETDYIAIHFRMGDYKKLRHYHPVMNYEYYHDALTYIMENKPKTAKTRALYFCESEDNEYVVGKIALLHEKFPDIEFVKVDDSIEDYEQVLIMSCLTHYIIPNSTFSWWGAYFNDSTDNIVCYPSVWFGEAYEHTHDSSDLIPTEWVKIQCSPLHWSQPLV